ncbi:MAG: KUP/HAK/KT family potassium transporter [Proteobacteria bacterium]|nr:KUP/HAK/KT family potassium transporter [Pseudomonadota bacterium]
MSTRNLKNTETSNLTLGVGALGVVYGDIGTSPLYALKSCFEFTHLPLSLMNICGIISLFIWTLIIIVSFKYIRLVLSFAHQGEGGILALSALCSDLHLKWGHARALPIILGVIGAALFFSDGIITPAISILSAVEGLDVLVPSLQGWSMWIAGVILLGLFFVQQYGSGGLGFVFGPIMVLWFATLAVLGLHQIYITPAILVVLNPYYAVAFLVENGWQSLGVMGGVILVITGVEALYADLGHFGKIPIKTAWYAIVCPALILNYMGQGALLIATPAAIVNPFYLMAPKAVLGWLIVIAIIATVIASQAVISGIFSIGWQAIMLGYLPKLRVVHTSGQQYGQVYIPSLNLIIATLTFIAVLHFRSSASLSIAYGLSVSGVMIITTFLVLVAAYHTWHWRLYLLLLFFAPIILLDLMFVSVNITKIVEGAWYPLLLSACVIYIISVWRRGESALHHLQAQSKDLKSYITRYAKRHPERIPEAGVFICEQPNKVPRTLLIHLEHNKLLHRHIVFLSIVITNVPVVPVKEKYMMHKMPQDTHHISVYYGFTEVPDLNSILKWSHQNGIIPDIEEVSCFFSRDIAVAAPHKKLTGLAEILYLYLSRNAVAEYEFYKVPASKIVELGVLYQV